MRLLLARGPANPFLLARLGEGRSLGRLVSKLLLAHREETWCLITAVGSNVGWGWHPGEAEALAAPPADPALINAVGEGTIDETVARLLVALGQLGFAMIVEGYLSPGIWRPGNEHVRTVAFEEEVYYVLETIDREAALYSLALVDDWFFKAFLVDAASVPSGTEMNRKELEEIARATKAIFVTAFDGDGFLLMLPPPILSSLTSQSEVHD